MDNIQLRDAEHATDNDVYENLLDGNLYLYPNTQAFPTQIVNDDYHPYPDVNEYLINHGNIEVEVPILSEDDYDPLNPEYHYIYFRDGSYFKVQLDQEFTEIGGFLNRASINKWFGYKDPDTGVITEVSLGTIGTFSGVKPIYVSDGQGGYNIEYYNMIPGADCFAYGIAVRPDGFPKVGEYFIPKTWNNTLLRYDQYFNVLTRNIATNGNMWIALQDTAPISGDMTLYDYLASNEAGGQVYPGDSSTEGGGDGDYLHRDAVITIPPDPDHFAIDFGFISIYNASEADLKALAQWLWSANFTDNINKNYIDPFNNILALVMVNLDLNIADTSQLKIGNTNSLISMHKLSGSDQIQHVDYGWIDVKERWGSFLDYNTTFTIWLPFIGFRSLKPDDMVDGEINVYYKVDLLTGDAVCYIRTRKNSKRSKSLEKILYCYNCNVFTQIPISGANYMNYYNQQLQASASGINNYVGSLGKIMSGDIINGVTSLLTGQQLAKREYETAKPDYGRGGNLSGNAGAHGVKYPYIIISEAMPQTDSNYNHLHAIPSKLYKKLGDLTGYTIVDEIEISFDCKDDEEKNEIIRLLKNGVYI